MNGREYTDSRADPFPFGEDNSFLQGSAPWTPQTHIQDPALHSSEKILLVSQESHPAWTMACSKKLGTKGRGKLRVGPKQTISVVQSCKSSTGY